MFDVLIGAGRMLSLALARAAAHAGVAAAGASAADLVLPARQEAIAMLSFLTMGEWAPSQVVCRWAPSSFCLDAKTAELIEAAWAEAQRRPGVHLFDGPMCRLESFSADAVGLSLALSPISYKAFLGTNMANPWLADQYGDAALANPVGISCALLAADGALMLGRRNQAVAYHPGRIHPFAGSLEPADGDDVFAAVRRELGEELFLGAADLADLRCLGMVADAQLRQPELIFLAQCHKTQQEIEDRVDQKEHQASCAIAGDAESAAGALRELALLTPVAVGAILLWGRRVFGTEWFSRNRPR